MHHVWAATAAAVVTVAGTAISAGMSADAAKKARAGEASAAKKMARKENEAQGSQKAAARKLQRELKGVQAPQWNLGADIADAARITGYNQTQLERLYPGARSQTELASAAISDYMRGVVPQDVQEQTMRGVAERGGAGFNIATAGIGGMPGVASRPQFDFARNLGLTSLQLQQYGMGASRDWQTLAGSFIESPLQVGQARLGFEQAATNLEMQKIQARYNARSGLAQQEMGIAQSQYGRQMQGVESRLAQQQLEAQNVQGMSQAVAGGLTGYGSAISAQNAASNVNYGGQTYGAVKGYEGQKYSPALTDTGALYYKR